MPTGRRYIAFWSYTRFDDRNDGESLTGLRDRLEAEVRALSGKRVEIFQDVGGIAWGEQWKGKLNDSADHAIFLIPIITPSYFQSEECRAELEQFVEREKTTGFRELILPLYYIECSQFEDQFAKEADRLAQVVAEHNYRDVRSLRHRSLHSYEVRQEITALANLLIKRLDGLVRRHLTSTTTQPCITAPLRHARVPRQAMILGTLPEVSEWIDVWLVVETGAVYHPQTCLSRGATAWHSTVYLGRSQHGLDANHEFPIHVLAVTEDVSRAFERYLTDARKRGQWSGLPKPPDSKVLATLRVIRDDSASMFQFMEGAYDEFTSDGTATGGIIRMKLQSQDSLTTEALNRGGKTEWTGSIKMATSSKSIRGEGIYNYAGKLDSGEHHLTIDAATGDLKVEGRNTSQLGGKSFRSLWKRRA
jgi:hypothetical protein